MTTTHHDAPSPEEKKYRNILDQMEEGYYETDLTGHFTYVNPAASAHLGRPVDELIGTNYQTYMAVDTAKTIFGIFNQVYLTGKPANGIECDIIHPDGALRIQEISVSLLRQPSGEPIGFFGISRDRTEQLDMERALRESEESYRSIMDLSPDAITINEVGTGRYVAANKAFFEKTGFHPDEVVGRTPEALKLFAMPEERLQFLEAMRCDCMDGLQVQFRSKDGTVLENLVSGRRIQFKGKPCFLFVSTEIASLKRTQQALRDSEESYRQVLELAPDAISLTRVSDGTCLEVSEAFCQQTGYTRAETVGRNALELNLYADLNQRRSLIADLLADGQIQGMEITYRARNGTLLHALTSARVIQFKGEACVLAVSKSINDIKSAQEALQESEENYRKILDGAPYSILITRRKDHRFVYINDNFCRRMGYGREAVIGLTSLELGLYANTDDRRLYFKTFEAEGRVDGMEIDFRSKSGEVVTNLMSGLPIRFDGQNCLLSMAVDITGRKRAERELEKYRRHLEEMVRERTRDLEAAQAELVKSEKLAVLGQLTATVSHELRNPLGVIRSSNFYLHRKIKEKDAKIDKHLKRIDDQVSMCDAIVADLLEYTRGRNASMVKEALTPWLAQVIQQIQESEGMAIAADLCADLPAVPHDREKMRRVIINVLDNAIQAVRAREQAEKAAGAPYVPEIRLTATMERDCVKIQVTDNGTGMGEETLQRAFEPLFTTRARGTGIGLANVKKIVEEHRGSVSLNSSQGEGTQLSIALPFGEN